MRILYLIRGLPGSGKSTLAKSIGGIHIEADQYFIRANDEYEFDARLIKNAHQWYQAQTESVLSLQLPIVCVANTFTQEWEMKPYYDLAEEYRYQVFSIIVENRHKGKNVHYVPEETITKMRNRFEIKL